MPPSSSYSAFRISDRLLRDDAIAVCLDGSPPGYHLQPGSGAGSRSWLIHLEGGGWCDTVRSCANRSTSHLGSSKFMEKQINFTGILSDDPALNPGTRVHAVCLLVLHIYKYVKIPSASVQICLYMYKYIYVHVSMCDSFGVELLPDFYSWNRVFVRYCDGASFAGDSQHDDGNGTALFFRGRRIWEAVLDELMQKGLARSKQASAQSLSGCSSSSLMDSTEPN
jgi:hypothetical protein